ncbi:YCII-related [Ceraceosorus bombacis]|uniref:YCII-related n=1 Tax=Ceraceosorus bombacis TaxID=401625 RepID=A0A0P1BKY5_9BASI|nr:YCII-related [Ceraceosorus bombacis]
MNRTLRLFASASSASGASSSAWAGRPSSHAASQTYLVVAHDARGADIMAKRLAVRENHLEGARRGKRDGRILLGGAILSRDFSELSEEGPKGAMAGSVMLVRGESVAEVRSRIAQDPYVTGGVWDPNNISVHPFAEAPLVAVSSELSTSSDVTFGPSRSQHYSALDADAELADAIAKRAAVARDQPAPSLGLDLASLRNAAAATLQSGEGAAKAAAAANMTLSQLRTVHTKTG